MARKTQQVIEITGTIIWGLLMASVGLYLIVLGFKWISQ